MPFVQTNSKRLNEKAFYVQTNRVSLVNIRHRVGIIGISSYLYSMNSASYFFYDCSTTTVGANTMGKSSRLNHRICKNGIKSKNFLMAT